MLHLRSRGRSWGNEDLGRYLGWWEASRFQLGSVLGLGKKRLPQKRCEEPQDYEHTSLNTHLIAFAFIKNGTSAKLKKKLEHIFQKSMKLCPNSPKLMVLLLKNICSCVIELTWFLLSAILWDTHSVSGFSALSHLTVRNSIWSSQRHFPFGLPKWDVISYTKSFLVSYPLVASSLICTSPASLSRPWLKDLSSFL